MLTDAYSVESYPLPAESLPTKDQVVITSYQSGEALFLPYLCGIVLFLFVMGILLFAGTKRLGIWHLLSFAALLAGFVPAFFYAQYVREFLLYGVSSYPAATLEQVRVAVTTFTSTSPLYAPILFVLGAVCVWRWPWTVLLAPLAHITIYATFPLRPLMAALVGTDVTIDGLAFLWLGIHTVMVTCGILGWLLGREVLETLRYRLEQKSLR
ncbi:MAG: hypothetical protein AVDCRST_MAG86-598 [uncultured Truepera sp.]|uniref:Uncharacterized protein n=1 Tax=uncultured Truepera sp. TaxID=543023 RepID=A0A6J4UTW0_9DEIN|nr:MAG: hypothetical protein AVDCRST_MAG86-598 [uncultured Truepera sp.]